MMEDTLKIKENEDGSFSVDWSPDDPKWAWMNDLTQEEIQVMMTRAIEDYLNEFQSE
jgi:hypothetical protein